MQLLKQSTGDPERSEAEQNPFKMEMWDKDGRDELVMASSFLLYSRWSFKITAACWTHKRAGLRVRKPSSAVRLMVGFCLPKPGKLPFKDPNSQGWRHLTTIIQLPFQD